MRQAAAYETGGDAWDRILKLVNTHSASTRSTRSAPESWSAGARAARTRPHSCRHLHPPRRGRTGLKDDFADAANYYSNKANEAMSSVGDAFNRARERVHGCVQGVNAVSQ
jgi:hypothetical protein